MQNAATLEASFAVLVATDGRFYFTLTAENGQIVGVSQMYTTAESARSGIASVRVTLATLALI